MDGSPRHLVVLPLPGSADVAEALAAIGRLERRSALAVLDAVEVERRDDGSVGVEHVSPPMGVQIDVAAWTWLLDGILVRPGVGGGEQAAYPLGGPGMSESFVAEVRESLGAPGSSLVFIVSDLDPGAAVSELRRFPTVRLVYGVLPPAVLERMYTER
jgi:uncharacterized membrane protein